MNDERLRELFTALRHSEQRRAPRFEGMWSRRAQPRRFSLVFVFVSLLVVVLTTAVVVQSRHTPQPSIVTWRAPTDFLLDTPGHELLHSVPDLKGNLQ